MQNGASVYVCFRPIADIQTECNRETVNSALQDSSGNPSRLGRWTGLASLAAAIGAGLGIVPAAIIAMLSQMLCDAGCNSVLRAVATTILFSPLLLIVSALAGAAAYRAPSWPLVLLTFIPVSIAGAAYALAFG